MTIIVATDLSVTSAPAARVGASLARRLGDAVIVAHVFQPIGAVYPEVLVDGRIENDRLRSAEAELSSRAETALAGAVTELTLQGVPAEGRLLTGASPRDELVELARSAEARMIILGTHGRRGVARVALGSVAEGTALVADCPVLVVPSDGTGIGIAVPAADRPLRVVVAVDRCAASVAAANWASALAGATPCTLTFVHLLPQATSFGGLAVPPPWGHDPDAAGVRLIDQEIRTALGAPLDGATLKILPAFGSPGVQLTGEAEDLGADLLVLGTRQHRGVKRWWLGSTMHGVLRASEVPVLCVPAPRAATQDAVPRRRSVSAVPLGEPTKVENGTKVGALIAGREPVCLDENDTVARAVQAMLLSAIRHIPVLRAGKLAGVVSERDLLAHQARRGHGGREDRLADVMTAAPVTTTLDTNVGDAAGLMLHGRLGCLPVLDGEAVVGIITRTDIIAAGRHDEDSLLGRHTIVREFMKQPVETAGPDDGVLAASCRMEARGVRHLPVIDGDGVLIGMLSDRDLRNVFSEALRQGHPPAHMEALRVREVMSPKPISVDVDATLREAAAVLALRRVGALAVVGAGGKLRGIVSYLDVLRAYARPSEQQPAVTAA